MPFKYLFASVCLALSIVSLVRPAHGAWPWRVTDEQQRTGYPQEQSPRAKPSIGPGNVGYAIGGGSPWSRKGEGPTAEEGTWGMDYQGKFLQRRVILNWWHGRRYQGGLGAYKTEGGPKLPEVEHPPH